MNCLDLALWGEEETKTQGPDDRLTASLARDELNVINNHYHLQELFSIY